MDRRSAVRWIGRVVAGAVVAGPGVAAGSKPPNDPPGDFRVAAQFGAGEGDWKSWMTTIGPDGRVVREVLTGEPAGKKTFVLSRPALRAVYAAVSDAQFFELPRSYEVKSTDLTTLVLTVTAGGRTHSVRVYGPEELKGQAGLTRFLAVWREVLRHVPSPNPEQKVEVYGGKR